MTRVHCQGCNKTGERTPGFTCQHCDSEDIFSARDYVDNYIADIESTNSLDHKLRKLQLGAWKFVLSELREGTP